MTVPLVAGGALTVRYAVGPVGSRPRELRIDDRVLDTVALDQPLPDGGSFEYRRDVVAAARSPVVLEVDSVPRSRPNRMIV